MKFSKKEFQKIKENEDFNLYLEFINNIINNINKGNRNYFYDLYFDFNKINNCDLFNLDPNIELKHFVPIIINYRKLFNNIIFRINYRIYLYCTGTCEYGESGKTVICYLIYL